MISLAIVLVTVVNALQVSSFDVDYNLLHMLQQIEGYGRLYDIQVTYPNHQPPAEALKDYFERDELDLDDLQLESLEFREQVFEEPCKRVTELYKANRKYFDGLPVNDIDFDKNYLCKVKTVVKACEDYLQGDNIDDVYDVYSSIRKTVRYD